MKRGIRSVPGSRPGSDHLGKAVTQHSSSGAVGNSIRNKRDLDQLGGHCSTDWSHFGKCVLKLLRLLTTGLVLVFPFLCIF